MSLAKLAHQSHGRWEEHKGAKKKNLFFTKRSGKK
jgi:hypothetical protein